MSQWYYADRNRQTQGPVPAADLSAHFRHGHIGLDTLVWREGLPQWQRLGDFAEELGLLAAPPAADAPIPPLPPPPPHAHVAPPAAAHAPAPKKGLSGGMIALIVVAALALPCLGMTAILAAIALPAYNDYTLRARTADAVAHGSMLKMLVAEQYAATGACPRNGEGGLDDAESYAGTYVTRAVVGQFDDGTCGFELEMGNTGNAQLDGRKLWFELDPGTQSWHCTSEIPDKLLPHDCRG